jgi:hypothetical protein
MNRIIEALSELWLRLGAALHGGDLSRLRQEDIYSSAADRGALLDAGRDDVRNRERSVQVVGPPVSSDGVAWDDEQVEYWRDGKATVTLKHRVARRCDCGAIISGDAKILGTCSHCSRILCNAEGCSARCQAWGALVCREHAFSFGDHTFCPRHRLNGLRLRLWEVIK